MNDFFIVFIIISFVISTIVKLVKQEQKKAQQAQMRNPFISEEPLYRNSPPFSSYKQNQTWESAFEGQEGSSDTAEGMSFDQETQQYSRNQTIEKALPVSSLAYDVPSVQSKRPVVTEQSMGDLMMEGDWEKDPRQPDALVKTSSSNKTRTGMLRKTRSPLMQGIVLSEVLGKPKALKD
ncbi:MAG: hypothetical protein ACYCX2_11175 [Christensenellales bacterium]